MCPVWRLYLLSCAHIKQTLIELTNLIRGKVHVLAILHHLVERLFLHTETKEILRQRSLLSYTLLTLGMSALVG